MSDETNLLQVSDFKYNILIKYEIQKKKKKKRLYLDRIFF